jgi:hypothetical protein
VRPYLNSSTKHKNLSLQCLLATTFHPGSASFKLSSYTPISFHPFQMDICQTEAQMLQLQHSTRQLYSHTFTSDKVQVLQMETYIFNWVKNRLQYS